MPSRLSKIDTGKLKALIEKEIKKYQKAIQDDKSFENARKIKRKIQLLEAELKSRNKQP